MILKLKIQSVFEMKYLSGTMEEYCLQIKNGVDRNRKARRLLSYISEKCFSVEPTK